MKRYETFKEWQETTDNTISESSLYTSETIYRLGQDRTFKKAVACLVENDIKAIKFHVSKEKYEKTIKSFERAGFEIKGLYEETTIIDIYAEKIA